MKSVIRQVSFELVRADLELIYGWTNFECLFQVRQHLFEQVKQKCQLTEIENI